MKQKTNFRLKNIFLLSALFIFSVALAIGVNAFTATINTPSTGGTIGVTSRLNVSVGEWGVNDTIRCALMASSPSTANSSTSLIFNLTNSSGTESVNTTFLNTMVLEDANDYTFTATCYNETGETATAVAVAASVTGVIVDRTVPQVPTSISPTGINTTTTLNFTSTVNGINTTGCTLRFTSSNPGQRDYAMTHSGNLCYLTISDIPKLTYVYTIIASDGTNSSTSSSATVNIDGTGNQRRKAAAVRGALGGGFSKEKIGKGLAIARATRAGEVSQGLAKAQAQISEFTRRETQGKELTKTGIGLGAGVAIGLLVPTLVIPGVGLITAPILGALIGAGVGIAI